jgi:hypothetical protein
LEYTGHAIVSATPLAFVVLICDDTHGIIKLGLVCGSINFAFAFDIVAV